MKISEMIDELKKMEAVVGEDAPVKLAREDGDVLHLFEPSAPRHDASELGYWIDSKVALIMF